MTTASLIDEAWAIEQRLPRNPKPRQDCWLIAFARRNGDVVRVRDAVPLFVADGMTGAKVRNVYTNLYGILERSPYFEQDGVGAYRLVACPDAARPEGG